MELSHRSQAIEESSSIKLSASIIDLKNQGKEIIGLNVGEPDFFPHQNVLEATKNALDEGKVRYSKVQGEALLIERLLSYHQARSKFDLKKEHFLVSNGSKQSLYQVFQTICNPGDEVIIFSPFWVSFPESIKLAGANPAVITTDSSLVPTTEQIREKITSKTKAVVINSPNNPSGAVYTNELLKDICRICIDNNIFLISDEAYIDLNFSNSKLPHLFDLVPEVFPRLISTRTFSKTHALTGFRLGYSIASSEITKAMNNLQGHLSGNNCTFSQYGAAEALLTDESIIQSQIEQFRKRRDKAFEIISPVVPLELPKGAFYLFPSIKHILKDGESCLDFCNDFLSKKGVAILPGTAFGHPGYIRIAFTASLEQVEEGCRRLVDFIKERR